MLAPFWPLGAGMKAALPARLPFSEIQKRLLEIFPQGTRNRGYCTREIAAETVFVAIVTFTGVKDLVLHVLPDIGFECPVLLRY